MDGPNESTASVVVLSSFVLRGGMAVHFRPAVSSDCEALLGLIRELTRQEGIEDQVSLTVDGLREDVFGLRPACEIIVCTPATSADRNTILGYLMWFPLYSPIRGRAACLEDFYIRPAYRRQGLGGEFLRLFAVAATARGCAAQADFVCQRTNERAIAFYRRHGAENLSDREGWNMFRFGREALRRLNCEAARESLGRAGDD